MVIELGILSYKLLVTLSYPIFYQIRTYIVHKNSPPLYNSFMSFMSYLSAGLIYLFVKHRSKSEKVVSTAIETPSERTVSVNQIFLEKEDKTKKLKIKKIIRIFYLSLINMIPMLIEFYRLNDLFTILSESIGVLSAISFYFLFSKIFFKIKIYTHQLISLFIISICLLIFLVIDIIKIYNEPNFFSRFGMSLAKFIILFVLYSLYDALVKKHFETYDDVPYHLMFFVGLFSLIIIIPIDIFAIFNSVLGSHIVEHIQKLYTDLGFILFILWFILDIIVGLFWLGGIMLTLYYFTPFHFVISEILSQLFSKCINWISKKEPDPWYLIVIYLFIYAIIIFLSLVYYEIIIIKLWSMEKDTFKYITDRQKDEVNDLQNNYDAHLTEGSGHSSLLQEFNEEGNEGEKQESEK